MKIMIIDNWHSWSTMILLVTWFWVSDGGCVSSESSNGGLVASGEDAPIDPEGTTGGGATVDPKGTTAGEFASVVISDLLLSRPVLKPGTIKQTAITQQIVQNVIYKNTFNYKEEI